MIAATDIAAGANAAIPGLTELEAALENARAFPTPLPEPTRHPDRTFEDAIADALAAVKSGHRIPADIAHATAATIAAGEEARLRSLLQDRVQRTVAEEREATFTAGVDHAMHWLSDALDAVLDTATHLAPALEGIKTADQADTAGPKPSSAWSKLLTAVDTYDAIRTTQANLVTRALRGSQQRPGLVAHAGLFRDPLTTVAWWRTRRRTEAVASSYDPSDPVATATVQWLAKTPAGTNYDTSATSSPWWPVSVSPAHMLLTAANDRTLVWLPTIRELTTVYEAALTATTRISTTPTTTQINARAMYYTTIGIPDTTGIPERIQPEPETRTVRPRVTLQRSAPRRLVGIS